MDRNAMARGLYALEGKLQSMDRQLVALSNVLKDIVGKELLRAQALHKVLMDKKLFTDEELKAALDGMIAEAKAELENEAKTAQAEKQKAVEILIPADVKTTPEGAVAPAIVVPEGVPASANAAAPAETSTEVKSESPVADGQV